MPRHAAGGTRKLAQGAGLPVAREPGDRSARPGGGVDVAAVAADGNRVRPVEPNRMWRSRERLRLAMQPPLPGWLQQPPGPLAPLEDRDRVAARGGDVHVLAARAERDRPRAHERTRALQRPNLGAESPLPRAIGHAAPRTLQLRERAPGLPRSLRRLGLRRRERSCGDEGREDDQHHQAAEVG